MAESICRNVVTQPVQQFDECSTEKYHEVLAHRAWKEEVKSTGEHFSASYRRGFLKGYADYLDHGGKGQPPVVPPLCYWTLPWQTPRGHDAAEDWFAGFRHGTGLAQASGLRQWATVPLSVADLGSSYGRPPGASSRPPQPAPVPAETLPQPREAPVEAAVFYSAPAPAQPRPAPQRGIAKAWSGLAAGQSNSPGAAPPTWPPAYSQPEPLPGPVLFDAQPQHTRQP
jgi:hypothetical protein